MMLRALLFLFFCETGAVNGQEKTAVFDRQSYYKAMEADQLNLVNDQLTKLGSVSIPGKEAFEGALTMKKAGLSTNPDRKLSLFKSGHKKLEAAIQTDSSNVEFRFLRLMIQEHAPGFLHYKGALYTDSEYIRRSYKTLSPELQQAIVDYSKKSKILKLG